MGGGRPSVWGGTVDGMADEKSEMDKMERKRMRESTNPARGRQRIGNAGIKKRKWIQAT